MTESPHINFTGHPAGMLGMLWCCHLGPSSLRSDCKTLARHLHAADAAANPTPDQWQQITAKHHGKLYAWLILNTHNMSTGAKEFVMRLSFFLESRGVSRSARDVLSQLGLCGAHASYVSWKRQLSRSTQDNLR